MTYIELHTRSAFSLLGGASLPEKLVERAAELGYPAIALTDQMDMGGIVCFAERAKELGVGGILGAQVLVERESGVGERESGIGAQRSEIRSQRSENPHPHHPSHAPSLVLLAETDPGYRNICRLITRARMECPRDRPRVDPSWLPEHLEGVTVLDGGLDGPLCRALLRGDRRGALARAQWLKQVVPAGHLYFEIFDHLTHEERKLAALVDELGERLGIPRVLTGDVRFATPAEKPIYDLLTCVRHRTRLAEAGTRLLPSSEWHLQPPERLRQRFRERPELLDETLELGRRLTFRFEGLHPELPIFPLEPPFETDDDLLAHLTWEGAHLRYPELTDRHRRQIEHELALIRSLGLAGYFVITWDIARFCRQRGILAQGRGSAANSAVCYCLRITAVDPIGMDLLFERFLSEGREDYPDIDIDIAHEWREEAIQYVYERYGRDRAALVCEQIRYRGRSAVRDAAWALGFEQDQIDRLAGLAGTYGYSERDGPWAEAADFRAAGVHDQDPRLPLLQRLITGLQGLPRHRSIHVGGMVLTAQPLCEIVPIEPASMPDRTVIQWEKDDLPYTRLAKFDLLGLGMLSLLQKALGHLSHERGSAMDLADIPPEDPLVYDALCRADTVGVFQIESRAQMNTLPRLKPRRFYDLVVEVALIRPGPIQGQMVHPYLRRRDGEEAVTYLHPDLEPILARTLGVPIFQEQVMRVAIELAGFSPSQADELRRAMGFRRYSPRMDKLQGELHAGMAARGIEESVRERIVEFLSAFAHYGFPESHSASFALLAYASAWLKVYHAPLFAACLVNSQPMGFYSLATIVQDARQHGVECRPPDLGRSDWDCTLEPAMPGGCWPDALRIGLRCVDGLGAKSRDRLEAARQEGPFGGIREVVERTHLPPHALAALAQAGAFDSFLAPAAVDDPSPEAAEAQRTRRREALWAVLREGRIPTEGLDRFAQPEPDPVSFEPLGWAERIVQDYQLTGLSTEGHAMEILRPSLAARRILPVSGVRAAADGSWVRTAGMVIVRQRPGTAKGFVFLSLEDETGILNVIVTPKLYERHRKTILAAPFLEVQGIAQTEGGVVQLRGRRFRPLAEAQARVRSRDFH